MNTKSHEYINLKFIKMSKKIITICAALVITASVFAQSPEKMSYQAVVRDGSNNLVTSTAVGMQISILQGSSSGTAVYVESQTPTSNANGLVSLEIGSGIITSGDFTTIDWGNGPYFIKTETDPTGGTNYTITGTSQLLSVPYALHAKTADSISGGIIVTATDTTNWNNKQNKLTAGNGISIVNDTISTTGNGSNKFYLGQDTLGGIVFYIYIGSDGQQHGLIVNPNEASGMLWQSPSSATGAIFSWDGKTNTALMTNSPIQAYVDTLTTGGFTNWYLPSIDELSILWKYRMYANKGLEAGAYTLLELSGNRNYWSSTEVSATQALYFDMVEGSISVIGKTNTALRYVRAIRVF